MRYEIKLPPHLLFERNLLFYEHIKDELPDELKDEYLIDKVKSLYISPRNRVAFWYLWVNYKNDLIDYYLQNFDPQEGSLFIGYLETYLAQDLNSLMDLESRYTFLKTQGSIFVGFEESENDYVSVIVSNKKVDIPFLLEEVRIIEQVLNENYSVIFPVIPISIKKKIILDKSTLKLLDAIDNPPKGAQNQFYSAIFTALIQREQERENNRASTNEANLSAELDLTRDSSDRVDD
jgi:hypothetical protein